jgi:hypothetical protein
MWPFGKRKAKTPQREYRHVLVSEGEGWIERRAWLDQAGSLWAASGDGYSILELVEGGKVKPASAHHQQMYGFERRWRDAPKPKDPRP